MDAVPHPSLCRQYARPVRQELRQLNQTHGDVVRFSANQVSFISAQAWRDIYGHGHGQLQKPIVLKDISRASDIIIANDADHTRFRKALAHGFSEKAMHQQEPSIKVYIDLLIEKLRDVATSSAKTDMVKWYNLTIFDMIGDLAFGTSFEGLKNNRLHAWVTTIFSSIKLIVFLRFARQYPILAKLPMLLLPRKLPKARMKHRAHVRDMVMRRFNDPDLQGRGHFIDVMQKHKGGPDSLSSEELVTNANVLIVAGSETTATLLSGEVRGAFENEDEINFVNASTRLTYLLACLDEAFRMYPPVPAGLQWVVPPSEAIEISGCEVAPGLSVVLSPTLVSVHQSAAYCHSSNFALHQEFRPERWLHPMPAQFANDNRAVLRPFSVGPRNCIGRNLAYNEMRLILARVLWNFDLQLWEEIRGWMKQKSYGLWEKPPMFVRLKERDKI